MPTPRGEGNSGDGGTSVHGSGPAINVSEPHNLKGLGDGWGLQSGLGAGYRDLCVRICT